MEWLAALVFSVAAVFCPISSRGGTTNFSVRGVLKEVKQEDHQLVIAHESIPNFMEAMTMPFNVRATESLTNLRAGEKITFQLHVTENESWIDRIERIGVCETPAESARDSQKVVLSAESKTNPAPAAHAKNPLRYYKFTNELGQPVSLSDFDGQAVALTFFFTRCPIPEFCPRLSRNFEEVQRKLAATPNAPTNWHLLSVTFDPAHDTPEVLKAYGVSYQYDPAHWSFLTGPSNKIAELARLCDVKFDPDNGFFNHNFRTLIINASNQLQMVLPTSGFLSDSIAQEILKAATPSPTNSLSDAKGTK